MTSKQTLLKALKEAEGPSRELDAMVSEAFGWSVIMMPLSGPHLTDGNPVPRYTSSLDACIALQKRVLPGCDYEVGSCGPHMVGARARVWDDLPETGDPWAVSCEHADDPALALCIAIVEALIAQEQETEHDYG